MTKQDMVKGYAVITTAYPGAAEFKCAPEELKSRVELWASFFADTTPECFMQAVCDYIKTHTFPPTIADIMQAVKKLAIKDTVPTSAALFTELQQAAAEHADLECDFYYTAEVAPGVTQGAVARRKAFELYEALHPLIKDYCGNYGGFLSIARDVNDSYSRTQARKAFDTYYNNRRTASDDNMHADYNPQLKAAGKPAYNTALAEYTAACAPLQVKKRGAV